MAITQIRTRTRQFCMEHLDFFSENVTKSQPVQNTALSNTGITSTWRFYV